MQVNALQINPIDVGDLKLAALRRLKVGGNVDDLSVVEIKSRHSPVGLWLRRLFLDGESFQSVIECHYTIAFRIDDMAGEDISAPAFAAFINSGSPEENIVADSGTPLAAITEQLLEIGHVMRHVEAGLIRQRTKTV